MTLTEELEQSLAEIERRTRQVPAEPVISYEQMKPYWDDEQALRQMWQFCNSFGPSTPQRSIAAWTETAFRYGRKPSADLRAKLIQRALGAGWKRGYKHEWDADKGEDYSKYLVEGA